MSDLILILDFGSPFTQVIARRVREANVYCEIHPFNTTWTKLQKLNPKGILLSAETKHLDRTKLAKIRAHIAKAQIPSLSIGEEMDLTYEQSNTKEGKAKIKQFLKEQCACSGDWTMAHYAEVAIEEVRKQVGEKKVVLGLSGGVDSSVAAALIHRAIGKQLICVFVDTGLMRKDEVKEVQTLFKDNFHMNLRTVRASSLFLGRLKGVEDPEKKRKIIGKTFIEVFEKEIKGLHDVDFLAQGTIYPDVIESVVAEGGKAVSVKSHHNVGGLPDKMRLKLLEPLRDLFKDEVRVLGTELGLPHNLLWRQPFPGPGLAVRVAGEITPSRLRILREADAIFQEEMIRENYYYKVWQSFAIFLPVRTVGAVNEKRTYDYVIALRIVESVDAMSARWVQLPHAFLDQVSSRIIKEVPGVNRVVLDISSKPPSTIEWE